MFALIAAAALSTTNSFTLSPVDPLSTRWTFGAHHLTMMGLRFDLPSIFQPMQISRRRSVTRAV